jgi:hypothetical protein
VAARCGSDALRVALNALRLSDRNPAADHAAAVEAFARGEAVAAVRLLEAALGRGFDVEVANDLAVACHAAGQSGRAAALLEECVVRQPGHAAARENLEALVEPQRLATTIQ